MISSRFAWAGAILFALALLPTLRHVYFGPAPVPPGSLDKILPQELGGGGPPQKGRFDSRWTKRQFDAEDFVSRTYGLPSAKGDVDFYAARTYDWKKLFHFPEIALDHNQSKVSERAVRMDGLPLRVLKFHADPFPRIAVYALVCERRPVARPYRFLFSSLPGFLFHPRRPMTLLYVAADAEPGSEKQLEQDLARMVKDAARRLLR